MRISDIFRKDISRRIEEVIKVDFDDEVAVARELDEYVVTDNLRESIEDILDRYQETINKPDEGTNIWVSGFFGSGKSSLAKNVGYLLDNPMVAGKPAADLLLAHVEGGKIRALLNTIHAQAPTLAVFIDLSSARNVLKEGENPVLPMYRALLESLDYSRDFNLAALEFELEGDGILGEFEKAFEEVSGERGDWRTRRNIGLARHEASHAMHLLQPATYPSPDSWARGQRSLHLDPNVIADQALEMLARRSPGSSRIVFVVDEVGQYVARDRARMLDLQGIAHAFQKKLGALWLIATSQETLDDVVDSLEGSKVELARVQDRFPLRIDLLPSDIEEVTSRRVLDKSADGADAVRAAVDGSWNKLQSHVLLSSPRRDTDFTREELVRLYPLLPYQIQLFIDAVSSHRARTGAQPMLGGSNRTIIKLAQQLVIDREVGLGDKPVGSLATADLAYDLLADVVPTAWQGAVIQVAERHGPDALPTRVVKATALLSGVPWLRLDAHNFAVLLHSEVAGESLEEAVRDALATLVHEEVIREAEEGYRLQSPEEKGWEKDRRGLAMSPAAYRRLRRDAIKSLLGSLVVSTSRTFTVGLEIDGESVSGGDVRLVVQECEPEEQASIQARSRESSAEADVYWTYQPSDETYDAALEAHRSAEMIKTREAARKSSAEVELLSDERKRLAQADSRLTRLIGADLLAGATFFRGVKEGIAGKDARAAGQASVEQRIPEVFPDLDVFAAPVKRGDALTILRSDNLDGLPEYLGDDGLGLVRDIPEGKELATDRPPLSVLVEEIRSRADYGKAATGEHLERHFRRPPYGAAPEAVHVVAAAAIRAGLVEVRHQDARIASAKDRRLDKVFSTLPAFRSATFAPQRELDIEIRARVAKRIAEATGDEPPLAVDGLAGAVRHAFAQDAPAYDRVVAGLRGLGLAVPPAVSRAQGLIQNLLTLDDEDVVKTCDEYWQDLIGGRQDARGLDETLTEEALRTLRQAMSETQAPAAGLSEDARAAQAELHDLLDAVDLPGRMAKIETLVRQVRTARDAAWEAARDELRSHVEDEIARVRAARPSEVDEAALEEALRPLRDLVPPDEADPGRPSIDAVNARRDQASAVAENARAQLQELGARTEIVRVRARDLYDGVVTSPDELDALLTRIRSAAEEALGDQKHFWLT